MKKKTQFHRQVKGSALMICLPLIFGVFLIAITLFAMSASSSKISYLSWEKAQADSLAEAGLSSIYAQMANVPTGTTSVNASPIATTSLSGNAGGSNTADGKYSAAVLSSTSAIVNGQLTYTYVIQGTGVAPNGSSTSKVRSTFTMTQNGMSDGFSLGDGAIKANGSVTLSGGSFTNDPTGNHGAGILANGTITANGSKTYIDGIASYFASSSIAAKNAFGSSQMASAMSFPNSTITTDWRTTWLNQAQEATPTYPSGNKVSGNLSLTKNATLTAPEYISGNLSLSGTSTLTVNPDPTAAQPCVLFVHGTVSITGNSSVVNKGVIIVSDGNQTFSGNSSVYSSVNMVNAGLFSFSSDNINAVNITGGSGVAKVGVVYAVNGGVTLSGGSVYQGSIISGGGSSSSVTVSGGSAVRYEGGWNASFAPFAASYTASGLSHWTRIQ